MRNILGEQNYGTLFCFNTQGLPLPKTKEIKRLLHVNTFKYYQTDGWYRSDIDNLLRTLDIVNQSNNQRQTYYYRGSYPCDHVMYVPEIVKNNSMFTLKYSQILVAAFRLGPKSFDSLSQLQNVYFKSVDMRQSGLTWHEAASRNAQYIVEKQLTDPTISDVDFAGLALQMSTYGDMAVAEARSRVKAWLDCHNWAQDTVCQSILDDIEESQQAPSEELAAA